jgi:ribA/ribD-fused uncharacterized protein
MIKQISQELKIKYFLFQVEYERVVFPTSEHAFQAMKFKKENTDIFGKIKNASSAHDAQKISIENNNIVDSDWDEISTMKKILRNKINQHPYALKKLLQSGNREIIEDSWRDAKWGWGENKNGKNLLGNIWMELRDEFKQ